MRRCQATASMRCARSVCGLPPADRVEAEGCGNPQGCADAVADDDQPSLSGALLMVVQGFADPSYDVVLILPADDTLATEVTAGIAAVRGVPSTGSAYLDQAHVQRRFPASDQQGGGAGFGLRAGH